MYIHVFSGLVATTRAHQIMGLSMLRSFGKIVPQLDQIWAWLSHGRRWSPGVQNPLKSSVTGPSLLVNFYHKIKFHERLRVNPPPPLIFRRVILGKRKSTKTWSCAFRAYYPTIYFSRVTDRVRSISRPDDEKDASSASMILK